jgi:hypothetical protein
MNECSPDDGNASCCGSASACVFTKALLSQGATCRLAQREAVGERDLVTCTSPVAHTNCRTLAALLRERATFALRLPRPGTPLMHARALQLQCGGVAGLQKALDSDDRDVHGLVSLAHQRHGSLLDLPWIDVVAVVVAWQPRRRRGAATPSPSP